MFAGDVQFEPEAPAAVHQEPEDEDTITPAMCWDIIESYFQQHDMVSQQINSFNNFMNNRLQARRSLTAQVANMWQTACRCNMSDMGEWLRLTFVSVCRRL